MNDNRTPEQKYKAWVDTVIYCADRGWSCFDKWVFRSPSGSLHDLSAAALDKLDLIEREGHFAV